MHVNDEDETSQITSRSMFLMKVRPLVRLKSFMILLTFRLNGPLF